MAAIESPPPHLDFVPDAMIVHAARAANAAVLAAIRPIQP
jgi:hypothetical protein